MTREFSAWVGPSDKRLLSDLLRAVGSPTRYRKAMYRLGGALGREIEKRLPSRGDVVLVCTVEDADYLARGVLEVVEGTRRVALQCFWNLRKKIGGRELAPIIGRYEEPFAANNGGALVVVKSIIAGACVVRTNLMEVIERVGRKVPLLVAAPVIHEQALVKLAAEFSAEDVRRIVPIWCARDSERTDGFVIPGIGGSVYELLGLGDEVSKNRVRPRILDERPTRLESV